MSDNNNILTPLIAEQTGLRGAGVSAVISLFQEGATVPFISRYRKERTGNLDETQVSEIIEKFEKLSELLKRKQTVLETIEEQGKLTEDLRRKIEECFDPVRLEDMYLPYKPKKRTRATVAREKGLEPLAALIMRQDWAHPDRIAERFVKGELADTEEAIGGAQDIIAEWISEDERCRSSLRRLFERDAVVSSTVSKGKEEEGTKYRDYFEFTEPLRRMPSHRLLAIFRGRNEGVLKLTLDPGKERALEIIDRIFVKGKSLLSDIVSDAVSDSFQRLLKPSLENEAFSTAKEKADAEAIRVFTGNLRQLLLAPPLGRKNVLAIDPGFRTGCKVVCLDSYGKLLSNTTVYPHPPQNEKPEAANVINTLVKKYAVDAIAVGDGTAGRETEDFLKQNLSGETKPDIFLVSEDGASVYSASEIARQEFPDYDLTVRGAVSIGRRLIDPLAELVKIDPKSIGVGQYQHDVDQTALRKSLDATVESCVNTVGVDLNTASAKLLSYVSGLGDSLAANIVKYRDENGPFTSRKQLLKVPRLGTKAFEQCAGFLRIRGAKNPLDNSAVHPESYEIVERMAKDAGTTVTDLIRDGDIRKKIDLNKYISPEKGLPTLKDIMSELEKPGRDPRGVIERFSFDEKVRTLDDLIEGMVLAGIVTNITDFGAFIDIGVKQDGLVHISQLADKYISDVSQVVKLQQKVRVKVTGIDKVRGRISLSMKDI